MRILATCPGRHGDILWTLPALRLLHETTGAEIDLAVAPKYESVCNLIADQPYIHNCASIIGWDVEETAPMTPAEPPRLLPGYDRVIHLAYRTWPMHPLPIEHFWRMVEQLPPELPLSADVFAESLMRPWLTAFPWILSGLGPGIGVVFTDEWAELKAGVLLALAKRFKRWDPGQNLAHPIFYLLVPWANSRLLSEYGVSGDVWPGNVAVCCCDMQNVAHMLSACQVVIADNSAGHVVARGLGKPVVMVEPAEARHHPIFYPYGDDGARGVTLVKGGDGRPTFDARHVGDVLQQHLERIRHAA
jgi:hypothetical protein